LDQIKLQDAQNALAANADENKLRGLKIASASQPLERILSTDITRVQTPHDKYDSVTVDDNGQPIFAEGDTNYDLVPVQKVEITDPVTGAKSVIERRLAPIMSAEQLGERQDKLEIAKLREESLSEQRKTTAALAAERLASPNWKRVGYGTNAAGKEVFVMVSKDGQKMEVPTELMPVQSGLGALGAVLQGITGGAPAAPKNIAVPVAQAAPAIIAADTVATDADTVAVDEETQALIDSLAKGAAPAAAPTAFKSMAEAQAAASSGLIKKGQKITVGGQSGTWQ
jgi:hypothetical protein